MCETAEPMCHHRWAARVRRGGHITNHLRLGSAPLMCCMYSCLRRGSKRQKAGERLFYSLFAAAVAGRKRRPRRLFLVRMYDTGVHSDTVALTTTFRGVCGYFKHGTVHALQITVKLNMESGRKVALIIHLDVPATVAKTQTRGVVPGVQVEINFPNKLKYTRTKLVL